MSKEGTWTDSFGGIGATLKALEDNGVTLEHLQKLRSSKSFAKRISKFIVSEGTLEGVFHREVRKIMNKGIGTFDRYNGIWGPEEWSHYFDFSFSEESLQNAMHLPWTTGFFLSPCPYNRNEPVYKSHFLFWIPPKFKMLSIDEFDFHLDLYTLQQRDFVTNLLQRECPSGWHLLYFDGIPDSNKHGSIGGPKFVLKDGYEPTPLILVVLAQSLYRKLHGYYLCNSKLVCKENLNDTRFALYSETPPEKLRICSVDYESTINLSAMLTK